MREWVRDWCLTLCYYIDFFLLNFSFSSLFLTIILKPLWDVLHPTGAWNKKKKKSALTDMIIPSSIFERTNLNHLELVTHWTPFWLTNLTGSYSYFITVPYILRFITSYYSSQIIKVTTCYFPIHHTGLCGCDFFTRIVQNVS